jgi:hypothetical protein
MAYGNEPGGNHHKDYLGKWVDHFRNLDDRRLYTGGSGWPEIPENEFHVSPKPRIQRWGEGLKSRINALPPETVTDYRGYVSERNVPVISHEIGQWCVYPNFDEIAKYRGYLKPKNFEIFRETLEMNHMLDQARDFLLASGKLQALCYKEDIESALRTPGMGGFQLLDLHDFPGQGTALVGILDPFWEEKGYIRPEEFRRFCDTTVLLARIDKRVFTNDEIFEADLEIAHFGSRALLNARFFWRVISEEGREVGNGFGKSVDIFLGNGIELGSIRLPLAGFEAPRRYRLEVGIENTSFENDWDFWVYPPSVDIKIPPELEVLTELDSDAIELLNEGGIVMWLVPPDQVSGDQTGTVATGFSSIFWNTSWTRRQAPHTLGILCDPKHPALSRFPTEFHSNWQWWYLVSQSQAMILDQFPKELRPIIQMIDDWFTNRRLGMAFEVRVGEGKLLVCSIDLMKGIQENPVARQMLHSLCSYMISDEFSPETNVDPSVLRELAVLEQVH